MSARDAERRRGVRWWVLVMAVVTAWIAPSAARAFDAADSFRKRAVVFSLQAGGGTLNNAIEEHRDPMWYLSLLPRVTVVPMPPLGSGWLRGTIELGGEAWFQFFKEPVETTAEGLKAVARYDFVGFGRVVPYVEILAGAGYKNFRPWDSPTPFTFVLEAGAGASYMVTPTLAISGGYRFQHLSNGGMGHRNRGYNSDGGVLGVSFFYP